METSIDQLKKLLNVLKDFTLWNRLFNWSKIKLLLIDANADLQKTIIGMDAYNKATHELALERGSNKSLTDAMGDLKADISRLREQVSTLSKEREEHIKEITDLKSTNQNYLRRGNELNAELSEWKQKSKSLESEYSNLKEEISHFKASDNQRRSDYEKAISQVNKLRDDILTEDKRKKEVEYHNEIERIKRLKETWRNHENNVQEKIRRLCNKHGIDYVDKVPFKGKPDNTIKINDEFIIFDAKSPAGEDLTNFPIYLRNQAENASKYANEEDVRREIFLVVPTNTLEELEQFEFKLSDYTVYVISIDSLEPILLALRKIEDYEFAEQLSPEERENICRVIGKFVHLSKRRIQIDGFFAKQFFELVYRSEADLPKDILEKVIDFEKAEKLNPPTERRSKQISNKELEIEIRERKSDAQQKGIETDDSLLTKSINKVPLYTEPKEDTQSNLFDQK